MIPTKTYEGTVEGDLEGYEIEMDLDLSPEGRAHLLTLMTDLYSDPEMAVVREYSTNARDAHIEIGNDGPIRVSTPTALSPYLVIQDFGPGLSVEEMERVYSKYGASSKRTSDEVNGMLGLGCKSALTYTSQFLIESVKDGIRAQVAVTRNENGIGVMSVVDTSITDLPNGVTIKIPAKNRNGFDQKVQRFFYYWQPGTVLVNGKQPKHMLESNEHTKINDNVFILNGNYGNYEPSDIVVMGGVAYPMRDKAFTESITQSNRDYYTWTVVFMEIGEVAFAPSREALAYTPRTLATIERHQATIQASIQSSIKAQLASATSYADAFRIWNGWSNVVGAKNLPQMTYKGTAFIQSVKKDHSMLREGYGRYNSSTGTRAWAGGTDRTVGLATMLDPDVIIFTGYPNSEAPTANTKRKVMAYLDGLDVSPKTALFFDVLPGAPWTDEVETHPWEDVKSIKLTSGSSGTGGRTGSIPILMRKPNGIWSATTTVDQSKPIVYLSPTEDLDYRVGLAANVLTDVQFVKLGANRWTKFERENPTAKHFTAWRNTDYDKAVLSMVTDDLKLYASYDNDYHQAASYLKDTDNPIFATLAGIKVDSNLLGAYNSIMGKQPVHIFDEDYPLAGWNYRHNPDHTRLYINAVHAAKGN